MGERLREGKVRQFPERNCILSLSLPPENSQQCSSIWRVACGTVIIRFHHCWWRLEDRGRRLSADHMGHVRSSIVRALNEFVFPRLDQETPKLVCFLGIPLRSRGVHPASVLWELHLRAREGLCLSRGSLLLGGNTRKKCFLPRCVSPLMRVPQP